MDLDITFDSRSTLGVPTEPNATPNAHLAAFDLDTVYGLGPFVSAQYYDVNDNAKLRIESGGIFEDLPRNADMTAIIPDPRTDQDQLRVVRAQPALRHASLCDLAGPERLRASKTGRRLLLGMDRRASPQAALLSIGYPVPRPSGKGRRHSHPH